MTTTVFGHRGIPEKYIENSMSGFKYLADHGEAVEFDVHLTKDLIPVIMHDEKIDRTTNGSGYIKDFSYEELKSFHLINDVNREQQLVQENEGIPTLDDVLAVFSDTQIQLNIELKTDNFDYSGIEKIVLNTIPHFHFDQPVIFSSFNIDTLDRLYAIDQTLNLAYLSEQPVNDFSHFMQVHHLNALHPGLEGVQDGDVIQRVWTVNEDGELAKLIDLGVVGVFTDDFVHAMQIRSCRG
ncbi:glycerophosphodiester phosphodiesterase family protein [Leuconostoc pseudomesenteroides]|uniref:glycerophosphodiester phosphodiesterase family protein n=1 Tax=Leuconostoc pseudomesenteroides TaxID=33968 RepID=UPI0039ED24F4